ncbi:MAG: AI-2E family transporter, partial [Coleofasciculaceae cyanobacterium]
GEVEQVNLGKWIGIFALILSLYILWQLRQAILLIFTAIVIANALNILVQRFHRSGMKRGFAVLLSIFLMLCILVGFFFLIVPPFADQFQELSQLLPTGINQLSAWVDVLKERISPRLLEYLPSVDQLVQQLQPIVNRMLGGGFSLVSNSLGLVVNILLVLILTLMLLADPAPYRKSFVRLFPSFYRRRVDTILGQCEVALRGWLVGILFNMFVIASLSFLGLLALGIPLALAQAALAGILTFIPNIGPALSVVPPIAIALIDEPWKAIAVLILYVLIQQIETNLLTPYVMAQQVSLLPAVTLMSQVFFATFFGFLGLLLALPLTVIGQVWLKEVVVKDILDQWYTPQQKQAELAMVSEATLAETSEQTKNISRKDATIEDNQNVD